MSKDDANDLITYLNSLSLLESVLQLFHTLKTSVDTMREVRAYHATGSGVKVRKEEDTKLFAGYFSKLAKLVANLTYLQKHAVEDTFFKNKEYIGLILGHTRMDENNPTLREWCLMVLRNLCQVSEGVREMLEKLKTVDVSQGTLEELGIKEQVEYQA